MKSSIHYELRIKLIIFQKDNEIEFFEKNESFKNDNLIIAREMALRKFEDYVEIFLETKGVKYLSDRQARIELNSYIKPKKNTKIKIDDEDFDISDGYGNGIWLFLVTDIPQINLDDTYSNNEMEEYLIHGISNNLYGSDYSYLFNDLVNEMAYYKKNNYNTNGNEDLVTFFSEWEWQDGYEEDQPETELILKTPFNWAGFDEIYWWGRNKYAEEETKKVPVTIEEVIKYGESKKVEFKPSLIHNFKTNSPGISVKAIIAKNIAAFMNTQGGFILIGLNDNGVVQGLKNDFKYAEGKNPKDFFMLEFDQMFEHFLSNSLRNNITTQFYEINNEIIFVVQVAPSKNRPVFLKAQIDKEFWIRAEASNRKLDIEEFLYYYKDRWGKG